MKVWVFRIKDWLRRLLFKEEDFEAEISTLVIKWDRFPNPTTEERVASKLPVLAHRTTARNLLGRWLLGLRYKQGGFAGPASFTRNGNELVIYPLRKEVLRGIQLNP